MNTKTFPLRLTRLLVFLFLFLCHSTPSSAQNDLEFEETDITVNVLRIGATDIPALIRDQDVYLSVSDLFTFLKLSNNISEGLDSLSGFILHPEDRYVIDKKNCCITYQNKVVPIKQGDLVCPETSFFLKSRCFGEIFGLFCTFDFRSLSVTIDTKMELPVLKEMKQQTIRNNINKLKGLQKADTTLRNSYEWFRPGTLDWSYTSTQQSYNNSFQRVDVRTGAALAGGNTELGFSYQTDQNLCLDNQYFLWRHVNNERPVMKQALLGIIPTETTSTLYKPVIGALFSNAPTTFRRSFGSYRLSDYTQPNWVVELYVNSTLVDYTKADASGLFNFDIPLVYGNSDVSLRFYGPWGEEQERRLNISIPFHFLPAKRMEYTVSAGVIEDTLLSRFTRTDIHYGLNQRTTLGGGMEYLSTGPVIPYLDASFRLGSAILFSTKYDHGVQTKTTLTYTRPSYFQLEMNYTSFRKGQTAIKHNYLDERKISVTTPIRHNNLTLLSRLALQQIRMPQVTTTSGQLSLSAKVLNVCNNFTTYNLISKNKYRNAVNTYSTLSQSVRLPGRSSYTHQLQYEYHQNKLAQIRFDFDKALFRKAYFNVGFEHNFKTGIYAASAGFRYDFSFAQTAFSGRINRKRESVLSESAHGSLIYDAEVPHVIASNRNNVGKGGLVIIPFLDLNANGVFDPGESKVKSLTLNINGGNVRYDSKDTVTRITELEAYTHYLIELNRNSLDNIAWQLRHATLDVAVDPDVLKPVWVPVFIAGEAVGKVLTKNKNGWRGLSRIVLQFIDSKKNVVATTLTESDGFYSYLGLLPGKYTVRIDPVQLRRLGMQSTPDSIDFTIVATADGDYKDGLDFVVGMAKETEPTVAAPPTVVQASAMRPIQASKSPQEMPRKEINKPAIIRKKQPAIKTKQRRYARNVRHRGSYHEEIYFEIFGRRFKTLLEAKCYYLWMIGKEYKGATTFSVRYCRVLVKN